MRPASNWEAIMGVGLGLAFDKESLREEEKSFSKLTDGKLLVYVMPRLDELCEQHKVTPFSTFAPDYDSLAEELPEGETLDVIWFDINDGLKTITRLIKATDTDTEWSKGLTKRDKQLVIDSLQELDRLLKIGKRKKARFSFICC
jgi:hypothetical protein